MELLSSEPVSDDFIDRLRADMDASIAIRFAVAYVSEEGVSTIGVERLVRLLHHPDSFGVATMACGCGSEPLLGLSDHLPQHLGPRLRYFMEPHPSRCERYDIHLMHTKLVFLLQATGKGVVYIGSHNWSGRALGGNDQSRRNAEASMRMEVQVGPGDMSGNGSSMAAQVNRHLLECFNLPICLDATEENRAAFDEWTSRVCGAASPEALVSVVAVLATCDPHSAPDAATPSYWGRLRQRGGVYLQILKEEEGGLVWTHDDEVVLLVWPSPADLAHARQPVVLLCRSTHKNAGPSSRRAGTSLGGSEIAGFRAAVWDPRQVADAKAGRGYPPPSLPDMSVRVPSGRPVHHFLFDMQPSSSKAKDLDDTVRPLYQVYLEVDEIIVPSWMVPEPGDELLRWEPDAIAFSSVGRARVERSPGYHVSAEREAAILRCLTDVFGVDPDRVAARPYSEELPPWVGLRLADHPIHEAYIGPDVRQQDAEFYRRARRERSSLVPDIFAERRAPAPSAGLGHIPRVFTAHTMQLRTLLTELRRRQ